MQWLLRVYSWDYLGDSVHAVSFRKWIHIASGQDWHDRGRVNWLRATAILVAKLAKEYDIRRSNVSWTNWLREGPSKSLGRHHKLSRVATGWNPSPVAAQERDVEDTGSEISDNEVTQDVLDDAEKVYSCPLSSQDEVDAEAGKWGAEWSCDAPSIDIQWPIDLISQTVPPDITVDVIRQAAHTFPARTGLGWDKLHPRAACR